MRRTGISTAVAVSLLLVFTVRPAPAAINETVTWIVIPPTGGSGTGTTGIAGLTCGWHKSCATYSSGVGLDWIDAGSGSKTVNIRANVKTSYQPGPVRVAYAKVFERRNGQFGDCAEVVAEIWGITQGTPIHAMNSLWLHVGHNGYTALNPRIIYFNGSWSGVKAGTSVGRMVNDPDYSGGTCSWDGYHVHAHDNTSGVTRNTSQIPPAGGTCFYSPDPLPCNRMKPDGLTTRSPPANYWERQIAWTYCYSGCLPG